MELKELKQSRGTVLGDDMAIDGVSAASSGYPPQPSFESFYFGSGIGYICYYFMRNDWVWSRLTQQEQEFVRQHNDYWNNNIPGYQNPGQYQGQGGKSFRSNDNREASWEGRQLKAFLENKQPRRVMEIGPGSGYYTRQIIECNSVEEYVATDINVKFLEYVNNAISEHVRASSVQRKLFSIHELESAKAEVDAIIILSALHHIPDREAFIKFISRFLAPGGTIFFYEPTHSVSRILQLSWSFVTHKWYSTTVVKKRNNYMTHHFCTVAETKKFATEAGLDLVMWKVKSRLPQLFRTFSALFSTKMVAALQKPVK
jgi:ubiquinone/menaquinone biosynthesis C-methylase UbiE